MWNSNLQTLMIGITVVAGVSLSACNSSTQEDNTTEISTEQAPTSNTEQQSTASSADMDGATTGQGTPVNYDLSSWNKDTVKSVSINEVDQIKSTFGKVVTTDENSLDYASNPATKYRFMDADAPYLDLIDSKKYLELGWYYANPTDSEQEKQQSHAHAQKSYQLARQLMGDEGEKVLAEMLDGQVIKNQMVGGQKIELAKCEFYSCMLVLNKSDEQQVTDS